MKKLLIIFLFFLAIDSNLYSQKGITGSDSLSVYMVVDKDIATIIDSFIVDAQNSIYYPIGMLSIYLDLYDDGSMFLTLNLIKNLKPVDSIILYKNPYYHQCFILYNDILFQANFMAHNDVLNYCNLTNLFTTSLKKQIVFFKKPPPDFYDTRRSGEIVYEDIIIGYGYDYYQGRWQNAIEIDFQNDD